MRNQRPKGVPSEIEGKPDRLRRYRNQKNKPWAVGYGLWAGSFPQLRSGQAKQKAQGTELRKLLATLIIMGLILFAGGDLALAASDWYVRPAGGNYGKEDGSSYQDAWDGLLNVGWGAGGVQAGDTLWVCGLHDAGYQDRSIEVGASGTAKNPIIIRGDFADDTGTIFSCGIKITSGWKGPDEFGVYSRDYGGSTGGQANEDMNLRLAKPGRLPDSDWLPGSFYQAGAGQALYYKPSSGKASDHVFYPSGDSIITIKSHNYVHIKNLILKNAGSEMILLGNADYIVIEGNTLKWGTGNGIGIWDDSNNGQIINNTIEYVANGIYFISSINSDNSDGWLVVNNTIHNINQNFYYGPGDSHGIGIQGGNDSIFEYNHIHNVGGSGMTFYTFAGQEQNNNIVRYNYVHDVKDLAGVGKNERGIEYAHDNVGYDPYDVTGNQVYNNIITNIAQIAIRTTSRVRTSGYSWSFYNNVIYNTGTSFVFSDAGFEFKNNILMNPTVAHISDIYASQREDVNNNIYYPDGADKFIWHNLYCDDFADWQNDSGLDATSFIADPHFVNSTGNYSVATDFKLRPTSPAIDAGKSVGLTQDFEGNPVPYGAAPDIGAYEYGSAFLKYDVNGDGYVNIQDVQACVNHISGKQDWGSDADVNEDGKVDETDIQQIVNCILSQ